jgi:hypothetical protein
MVANPRIYGDGLDHRHDHDQDHLESLEESLYSRSHPPIEKREDMFLHGNMDKRTAGLSDNWNDADTFDRETSDEVAHISVFSKSVLWLSLIFFIIAIASGAYVYFRGGDVISSNNISISVAGPITIGGGQELDLTVTVQNQNSVDLTDATLNVDYPDGTRSPNNISSTQLHTSNDLGAIPAGGTATQNISAVFFGAQGAQENLTFTLNYQAKGSTATFEKQKVIQVSINSVPVSLTINSLKEINSGQQIELDATIGSNSQTTIQNLLLKASYGFGFVFVSSTPAPIDTAKDAWLIGTLAPGQQKTIKIVGQLTGQDGEDQAFNFTIGTQSQQNNSVVDPVFLTATQTVAISKPFIGINLSLDGSTNSTYITNPGQDTRADITWINNSPTKVNNAKITVSFGGAILDKTSVQPIQGYYDSLANTITWDQSTNSELATVSPGDTGTISFDFASLLPQIANLNSFHNAAITLNINVSGTRADQSDVPNQVLSSVIRTVNFDTDLEVVPRITYSGGPFTNSGPIPPRVEKTTTYTVILALTNTFNDTQNVKVSAFLPQYVNWLGAVSPSNEMISYASTTGTIEWDPGNVPAGTGFSSSPRQVDFQVSFTPSLTQVGSAPALLSNINLTGTDSFTNDSLSGSAQDLTGKITSDANYQQGDDVVTP